MSIFLDEQAASAVPETITAFQECFGARLARTCRDLKRHDALNAEEEELIGLVLDTPHLGVHALPVFPAAKARQLGWPD